MFVDLHSTYTYSSAPKWFAKSGWQTRTFCHKNVEKAVAKLESDHRPLQQSEKKMKIKIYCGVYVDYSYKKE